MDKIKKLLKKISKDDRARLLVLVDKIVNKDKGVKIQKIQGTQFYRVRSGKFRIIFHYEGKDSVIDNIRMRSEDTYKNL